MGFLVFSRDRPLSQCIGWKPSQTRERGLVNSVVRRPSSGIDMKDTLYSVILLYNIRTQSQPPLRKLNAELILLQVVYQTNGILL